MNVDLLNNLLPILLPPLISASVVLYHYLISFLPAKRQASANQVMTTVKSLADMVVQAVEQTFGDDYGPNKKAKAMHDVMDILEHLHINASPALIDNAIEEAVALLKLYKASTNDVQSAAPAQEAVASSAQQAAV